MDRLKLLVADGCSWTAGDMVDPVLFPDEPWHVNHPLNAPYRFPKVWPHKLGKLLNVETENIASSGSSNDGIVRRILHKIPILLKKYKAEEICVVIGWTSPERKDFFFKEPEQDRSTWDTFYPAELDNHSVEHKEKIKFYNIYGRYYWNKEEYVSRYMISLITIHNYLKVNNIKHFFFDAFYEAPESVLNPDKHAVFESVSLNESLISLYDLWKNQTTYLEFLQLEGVFEQYFSIYEKVFIKESMIEIMKLEISETKQHNRRMKVFDETYHPTEFSHKLYAKHLYNRIQNHFLTNAFFSLL